MAPLSQQVRRVVPVSIKKRLGRRTDTTSPLETPCFAPFSNVYLYTSGDVRACCVNDQYPLGNITEARLPEIWGGARQAALRQKIVDHDFSAGCDFCSWAIDGGMAPYAQVYDHLRGLQGPTSPEGVPQFPRRIEFNLSNSCNLQCKMCAGDLSSSIRLHREKLPPLPKVWDDQFFDDLREFIPHLSEGSFAGGEPFMGTENFRVWDLMAELNPDARCLITTNGTQWNKRVERVLDQLRVWPNISLDAHTKETFEYIREKADHDLIMTNLDKFAAYAERNNTSVQIMHCLMPQNYHELADLLLFAEDRGMSVTVTVVTHPVAFSLEQLDRAEITQVHALFARNLDEIGDRLILNRQVLVDQVVRLENWLATDRDPHRAEAPAVAVQATPEQILEFPRQGTGPIDAAVAGEIFASYGAGAMENTVTVDADGHILDCSASAARVLGLSPSDLLGAATSDLLDAATSRFGAVTSTEEITVTDDLSDRRITYGDVELRVVLQPLRDDAGWADRAMIRFATATLAATDR